MAQVASYLCATHEMLVLHRYHCLLSLRDSGCEPPDLLPCVSVRDLLTCSFLHVQPRATKHRALGLVVLQGDLCDLSAVFAF